MLALFSSLALLPTLAAGQDLGVSAVAMGMAGQVASVAVNKMEKKLAKKMEKGSTVTPCVGPHCCQGSTCMNLPGLHCSLDRGPTKCIGTSTFPPQKGMCGCLVGACSPEGTCSSQGLPDSFDSQPAQAAQPPAAPAQQAPAAQQAAPAQPQPTAAGGDAGKFSQWHGQGEAAGGDQFNKWHTASRLYAIEDRVPPEDFSSLSLLAYGGAIVSFFVGSAVVCARAGRGLRERRSVPEEEGLVDSEQEGFEADPDIHEA